VGDLIYYATGGDCSCDSEGFCAKLYHVAIEAGNGKMFEAQKTGTQVGFYDFRGTNACESVIRHW
jgi:cell wall-associated NlpC family hydrolase